MRRVIIFVVSALIYVGLISTPTASVTTSTLNKVEHMDLSSGFDILSDTNTSIVVERTVPLNTKNSVKRNVIVSEIHAEVAKAEPMKTSVEPAASTPEITTSEPTDALHDACHFTGDAAEKHNEVMQSYTPSQNEDLLHDACHFTGDAADKHNEVMQSYIGEPTEDICISTVSENSIN